MTGHMVGLIATAILSAAGGFYFGFVTGIKAEKEYQEELRTYKRIIELANDIHERFRIKRPLWWLRDGGEVKWRGLLV